MDNNLIKEIHRELKIHAHALGIPEGAAESFIKTALDSTQQILSHKKVITDTDLSRTIVKELKKFNADLAYVYQNRDKII